MKALTRLGLIFLLAICAAARAADNQDPNAVAVAALEAMNKGDGAQFVALAHPDLKKKMRDSVIQQIVADLNRGRVSRELGALGVATLPAAEALPVDTVTQVTIERMRDNVNPALRERMKGAKFSVVNSTREDDSTKRLLVSLELPSGDNTRKEPFEVRVKKFAGGWMFYGHTQMMPGPAK